MEMEYTSGVKPRIWIPILLVIALAVLAAVALREPLPEPVPVGTPEVAVDVASDVNKPMLRIGLSLAYSQNLLYKALVRMAVRGDRGAGLSLWGVDGEGLGPLELSGEGYTSWRETRQRDMSQPQDRATIVGRALVDRELDCAALSAPRMLELAATEPELGLVAVAQLGQPGEHRVNTVFALGAGVAAPGEDVSGLRLAAGAQPLSRLTLGGLIGGPPPVLDDGALLSGLRDGSVELAAGPAYLLGPLVESGELAPWRALSDEELALGYQLLFCRSEALERESLRRTLRRTLKGYRSYLERHRDDEDLITRYHYPMDGRVDVRRLEALARRAAEVGLTPSPVPVVALSGEGGAEPSGLTMLVDNRFVSAEDKGRARPEALLGEKRRRGRSGDR